MFSVAICVQSFSFSLLGNVIKAILKDFEGVKKTISYKRIVPATFRETVKQDIRSAHLKIEFPLEISNIEDKLVKKLSTEEQNVIENQVQFLKFMIKLKKVIKRAEPAKSNPFHGLNYYLPSRASTDDPEITLMKCELDSLLEWVMKDRQRFSEQELEEFNDELHRAWLMLSYLAIRLEMRKRNINFSDDEKKYMKYVKTNLEAGTKLSK